MFSVAQMTAMTFSLGLSRAIARIAPNMAAPPAISYFIFSMPSADLIEMPPVSKVLSHRRGRVCAMIPSDLRDPLCGLIALADCRGQLSTCRHLNFSPHLCLPECCFCLTLGSILDEATTHRSVANMVSQCEEKKYVAPDALGYLTPQQFLRQISPPQKEGKVSPSNGRVHVLDL